MTNYETTESIKIQGTKIKKGRPAHIAQTMEDRTSNEVQLGAVPI